MGGYFGQGWIWAAIVVLVAIIVLMYALASRYYARVARPSGCARTRRPRTRPDPTPVSAEELALLVDSRRPDVIGLVGVIGLLDHPLADDVQAVLSAPVSRSAQTRGRRPGGGPRGL